jgi:hypothetical protein
VFKDPASRRLRTVLTTVAVAVSVMVIVTLSVVTASLERSAAGVLQMGNAEFIVAQKGSPSVLESVATDTQAAGVTKIAGGSPRRRAGHHGSRWPTRPPPIAWCSPRYR